MEQSEKSSFLLGVGDTLVGKKAIIHWANAGSTDDDGIVKRFKFSDGDTLYITLERNEIGPSCIGITIENLKIIKQDGYLCFTCKSSLNSVTIIFR